jgi:dienelactone hydrolase
MNHSERLWRFDAVVVFHHALGLTPGIVAFADELRRAGHTVHTPDLFEGRTFPTLDDGVRHAEEIGFGEVIERSVSSSCTRATNTTSSTRRFRRTTPVPRRW